MGWVVNAMPLPLYLWERDLVPVVQEIQQAPGSVWKGAENLTPIGIQSLDRLACSESLYQLS